MKHGARRHVEFQAPQVWALKIALHFKKLILELANSAPNLAFLEKG